VIRWANTADTDRWADQWVCRWTPPRAVTGDRHVRTATLVVHCRGNPASALAATPAPAPGGRLILALTVHRQALDAGGDWLAILDGRDLTPELPHMCQPVPGDPSFTPAWLDRHTTISDSGFSTVGLLLARRLDDVTLRCATFAVVDRSPLAKLHYPLPPGWALPLPVRGTALSATDIAAALGLRLAHCLVVINELVWAGALSISVRNER
jgi:hypothetical protein